MQRLNHRGPDGMDVFSSKGIMMGHWHFWTTPEEVGERQPLIIHGFPFKIVVDGRIDNRNELFEKLGISLEDRASLSDAGLILYTYARWGKECFKYFIGDFALVIYDERENKLICARDQLGSRTLFYAFYGEQCVIASEPWAVAAASGRDAEINETGVAHFFALNAPADGQTLFKEVYELLSAHILVLNAKGQRDISQYWHPNSSKKVLLKSDGEYAERFRLLMEESIRCRLRSASPAAILMSGGLDSTSITCLAANISEPSTLTTVSCVFDILLDCDERKYINEVKDRWKTNSIEVLCDEDWPLRDWKDWPINPNYPTGNAYRLVKERAYQRAQQEGLRVILTGDYGDHLYSGADDWLADLLLEGKFQVALQELLYYLATYGFSQTLRSGFLRRLARRLVDLVPGGKRLKNKTIPFPWLTHYSASLLPTDSKEFSTDREVSLLGRLTTQGSPMESFNASRYALELRYPYRDLRLVEYMLAIPAHQLYRQGIFRYILRNAMQDVLPDLIRSRFDKATWISLFFLGLAREKDTLQKYISDPSAAWRKFVSSEWVSNYWDAVFKREQDGADKLVTWLCISFETWNNYHMSYGRS